MSVGGKVQGNIMALLVCWGQPGNIMALMVCWGQLGSGFMEVVTLAWALLQLCLFCQKNVATLKSSVQLLQAFKQDGLSAGE